MHKVISFSWEMRAMETQGKQSLLKEMNKFATSLVLHGRYIKIRHAGDTKERVHKKNGKLSTFCG